MTVLALILHPEGSRNRRRSTGLFNGQAVALHSTIQLLEEKSKFNGKGRRVAVLTSPAPEAANYAKVVATHFAVDLIECDGLLRYGSGPHLKDPCNCITDYFSPKFDLAIAIVGRAVGEKLAKLLSEEIGRPYEKKAHSYII